MRSVIALALMAAVVPGVAAAQMRHFARVLPDGSVSQPGFAPSYATQARTGAATPNAAALPPLNGAKPSAKGAQGLPDPYRVQAQTYAAPSASATADPNAPASATDLGAVPAGVAPRTGEGAAKPGTPANDGWRALRTETPRAPDAPTAAPQ